MSFSQSLDFTYSTGNGQLCTPAVVTFSQQHSGNPKGYMWDFGNGQKSNLTQPAIIYNSPGTYRVKLLVVYESFTREITKSITLKSSTPVRLSANRTEFCTPGSVQFNLNSNPNFTGFQWNFGDNSGSYSTVSNAASHPYSNFGNYNVIVTATNTFGCKTSDTTAIYITPLQITGNQSNSSGCIPVNNQLQTSVALPAGSTVSNYLWNFGDGSQNTTFSGSTTHSYNQTGDYLPQLTIQTNDGCTGNFIFDSVHYGNPPTNLIARPMQTRFCGSLEAGFYAKADRATRYEWNFGFGARVSTNDTIINHKFSSLGIKNVTVTPYFNDCPGIPQTFQVEVIGTIAKFNYRNTCSDKRTFSFINTSAGNNLTYTWNFGAYNATSQEISPTQTYPRSGNFNTVLIAHDALTGCSDTNQVVIYTATPNLINAHEDICVHTDTRFRVTNSYRNNSSSFEWNIMGQTGITNSDSILTYRADSLGYFNNYVIVRNGNAYCPDTAFLNHTITVKGPAADFTSETSFCQSNPLQVNNITRPFISTDSIVDFKWNFGEQNNDIAGLQPYPYQYGRSGNFNIRLIAKDVNGCKDTAYKMVSVRPMPFLWIIPQEAKLCQGASDSIIAYTSDSLTWNTTNSLSNFCNSCDSNYITPMHSTGFVATAVNQFNCVTKDSSFVKIFEPFQATPTVTDTAVCEKTVLQIEVYPADKQIIWNPPIGLNSSVIYNPIVNTMSSRMYNAVLTDSMGCYSSTAQINVTIKSNPLLELGNNRFLPYETPVTLSPSYSNNIRTYEWSGSNSLSCNNCPNPIIQLVETEHITLKVTSDSGCTSTDNFTLAVECNNAYVFFPSAFTPDGDGRNDKFYPFSKGIKHMLRFMIFDRSGKMLFHKNDFSPNEKSFGWDGRYLGVEQAPGTYVYLLEAVCDMGQRTIKKGSFILIR